MIKLINAIKKISSSLSKNFKEIEKNAAHRRAASIYQIQDIDHNTGQVILYYRGGHTIVNTSIKEIICDPKILAELFPIDACYLGYYHGKLNNEENYRSELKHLKEGKDGFWLKDATGRFKIISFDPPDSTLTYLDQKINKIYKEHVIAVMKQDFVINNLESSQACYIGILTGEIVSKKGETALFKNFETKGYLRIIK